MDIALYCGQDDLPLLLLNLPGAVHPVLYHLEGRLGRLRAHEQLWKEEGSGLKALADPLERWDHHLVDHI